MVFVRRADGVGGVRVGMDRFGLGLGLGLFGCPLSVCPLSILFFSLFLHGSN